MTGSALQRQLLDFLNGLPHCVAWKIVSANERGVPDVLACIDGSFWAFEVKGEGDSLKPIQAEQMLRVAQARGHCMVVEGMETVKFLFRRYADGQGPGPR